MHDFCYLQGRELEPEALVRLGHHPVAPDVLVRGLEPDPMGFHKMEQHYRHRPRAPGVCVRIDWQVADTRARVADGKGGG